MEERTRFSFDFEARRNERRRGERRLTRSNVLPSAESQRIGHHALTSEQVVGSSLSSDDRALPRRKTDGPDSVGIPEGDESETSDHGRAGVGSDALGHEVSNGGEDVLLVDSHLAGLLEVVGEDVEEELRVGIGVDVSMSVRVEEVSKLLDVGEVSVLEKERRRRVSKRRWWGRERSRGGTNVSHNQTVRSVDVEGLSLSMSRRSSGRVSN